MEQNFGWTQRHTRKIVAVFVPYTQKTKKAEEVIQKEDHPKAKKVTLLMIGRDTQ